MSNEIAAIKAKRLLINIAKYVLLVFAAFVALVPIVSCVITAFKTDEEYASTSVMTLPESWLNFDNFVIAWQKADMGHAFLNSFIVLVCVLAGSVLISSMLAYVLNRFKFHGNTLIRNLFTIATLIPGIATQVTVYQIMTSLHLVNSLNPAGRNMPRRLPMYGITSPNMWWTTAPAVSGSGAWTTMPGPVTAAPLWSRGNAPTTTAACAWNL